MSKYRILEKEGKIWSGSSWDNLGPCIISRFIVQEDRGGYDQTNGYRELWTDFVECSSLEEAKGYKRSLELKDGIVVG